MKDKNKPITMGKNKSAFGPKRLEFNDLFLLFPCW